MVKTVQVIKSLKAGNVELAELNKAMQLLSIKEKRRLFIALFYGDGSPTFGNANASGLASGFKPMTARMISTKRPSWFREAQRLNMPRFEPDHIISGIQHIAQNSNHDMAKLKAYEMLGKLQGMFIDRSVTQVDINYTNTVPRPLQIDPNISKTPIEAKASQALGSPTDVQTTTVKAKMLEASLTDKPVVNSTSTIAKNNKHK